MMKMIYYDVEQGTDEWHNIRAGHITASVMKTFLARSNDPSQIFGKGAQTQIDRIVGERLSGKASVNSFYSRATERGKELEIEARRQYAVKTFAEITLIGFVGSEDRTYGCSPDWFVDDRGMAECKGYSDFAEHTKAMRGKNDGPLNQIQFQLFCCREKIDWCDYVSYYPEGAKLAMAVKRFYPDYDLFKVFEFKKQQAEIIIQQRMEECRNSPIAW